MNWVLKYWLILDNVELIQTHLGKMHTGEHGTKITEDIKKSSRKIFKKSLITCKI